MLPDQIFAIANLIALCGWACLALWPRRRWADVAAGAAIPALLAAVYVGIVATTWGQSPGGFSSLLAVATLFDNPWMLLAGWIHYLAFDLLVGRWEVRDAFDRAIPHLFVLPCLALTFLFGPAGWIVYLTLRSAYPHSEQRAGDLQRVRPAQ